MGSTDARIPFLPEYDNTGRLRRLELTGLEKECHSQRIAISDGSFAILWSVRSFSAAPLAVNEAVLPLYLVIHWITVPAVIKAQWRWKSCLQ